MNRIIAVSILMLFAGAADAQTRRTFKDIDRELKQAKSTATAMELAGAIAEIEPQTEEDIRVLGQLMDSYPREGQRSLSKVKNPKLAKAIMKECDREVAKFKADKDKDWKSLPEAQRQEKFNALLNAQAIMSTLGNLKNKEALPYLKQYITSEYDGTLSYTASQAIGRIAPDDPTVFKELWDKQGVKDINYVAYRKSILKDVAEKTQDARVSVSEKTRLLGRSQIDLGRASDPGEKQLLKDIVKNHPYGEMREVAGQSLMHSMREGFDPDDKVFLKQWLDKENEGSIGWALYAVRDHWDPQYVPELLKISRQSRWGGGRARAAEILGQKKVKEALPQLKECIEKDREANVRGQCRESYYKISGEVPPIFKPEDVAYFDAQFVQPYVIDFYAKMKETDPERIYHTKVKNALREYKRTHP